MSRDRIGSDEMPLTQEFLGQMLGTRRSTVSVAASTLQKAGMITYTRGNVTILDKSKLEDAKLRMLRDHSKSAKELPC